MHMVPVAHVMWTSLHIQAVMFITTLLTILIAIIICHTTIGIIIIGILAILNLCMFLEVVVEIIIIIIIIQITHLALELLNLVQF